MANDRTRAGSNNPGAPTEEPSITFDARDTLRGRYDDATVADVAEVDS